MRNYAELLQEFENASGRTETLLELLELRYDLIDEEYDETMRALEDYMFIAKRKMDISVLKTRTELLKELCDLVYVVVGTAVSLNMDFDTAFRLVHENNMLKCTNPERAENGKILKKNNHPKPNLEDCV